MTINPRCFARLLAMAQSADKAKSGSIPSIADLLLRILGEDAAEQLILLIGELTSADPVKCPPKLYRTPDFYVLETIESDAEGYDEWFRYEISLDGEWRSATVAAQDADLSEADAVLRISDCKSALIESAAETERLRQLNSL